MMHPVTPRQVWWTAEEIASSSLPDVPTSRQGVEALAKRLSWRSQPGHARRREGRGGGWEYHWQLLPMAAQTQLIAQAKLAAGPSASIADRDEIWSWFEALPEAVQEKARGRLGAIQKVEALEPTMGRFLAVHQVASLEGCAARSIWNWIGRVEGVRRDDRLPHLAPRHRAVQRKVVRADFDEEAFDWLKSDYLRLERPSFSSCYRRVMRVAREKGWVLAPERTMRRYLDARVSQPVQVLARMGSEALKRMYPPQVRDKTALHALEVVNGDVHMFDTLVEWPGVEKPVRPQMVAFQDVFSGRILSWRLDLTANSEAVKLAAGDMIEDWGIPEHVVLDNGREFAAKLITGGAQTRFRFHVLEDDIPGLFVALGCEIHWATPYAGQSKPIERAFRDMCDTIAKDPRFAGAWAGNRPDAKPENYGSRAVPLEVFMRVVAEGIEEHNLRQGRRSEVAWGRSFAEVFDESYERSPIRKATEAQRRLWLMGVKGVKADARTGRVKLMGNEYWSDWMHEIAGDRVIVRFDPADLHAGVHVYAADNRYLGAAECLQKGGFLSVEDARMHAKARGDWLKAERAALKAHKKLTARELGVDLDAIEAPAPAPAPEAKVVRPLFKASPRPAAPAPAPQPGFEAALGAVVADLAAHRAPKPASETPRERFRRALELERRVTDGGAVTDEQARWLKVYQNTPEYRAEHTLWSDFGDAYFG